MENVYLYEEVTIGLNTIIKRTDTDSNEAWIPTDPANSDYAAYVAWLESQTPVKE